jgi:hypothetical protein
MQHEIAPPVEDRQPNRREVIGEYVQPAVEEMLDRNRQAIFVQPGSYPVVAAMTQDAERVLMAGIIFDGIDRTTGQPKTLVEFRSTPELLELSKGGKFKLDSDWSQSILEGKSLKQFVAEKPRLSMRR